MTNISFNKEDHIEYEPFNLILRSVEVPDGLSEKVLEAMTQKRKEIEEIQHEKLSLRQEKQEKKAAHKSVAIRAAVIAAVITLMILIIPSSRQVVVSAAESAWNGIIEWMEGMEGIEWMEGYGWINPFYKPTDYYTDQPYPEDAVRGNAEVSTKEIHSNIVKYPNYSYETDFKEDPNGQMSFKSKMPLKVESKDFVINIHDMKLEKYDDPQVAFSDMFFYCTIKRIPSYDMSEKEYHNIWSWSSKIGTHHYPDYFSYSISTSSSIELSFLKNNKECIRINYNCFYDNFLNYEMSNPSITWYDSKYQYLINNPVDQEPECFLGNILLKIKPENVEICSVTIIFDEMTDLTTTNNFNVIKKILKKDKNNEYKYIDSSENFPFYYVFKSHANIVAGYNPKYYDIEAEAEKNQKLIDEFNSRVK